MSWKIRFYTGLNQGIDIPLETGPVRVGSDPLLADVVLIDEGIAAVHLTLNVSEEAVVLAGFADNIAPCQNGFPLAVGNSLEALACQQAGPLIWAFCSGQQSFPARLEQKSPVMPITAAQGRSRRMGYLMVGLSVLLLIIILGLLSEGLWRGKGGTTAELSIDRINSFLKEQGFDQVYLDTQPDSVELVLRGWLDEIQNRLLLQRFLTQAKLPVRLDIRTQEEIKQQVDFIIQKLGYDQIISLRGAKAGWIQLTGKVREEDTQWPHLEERLKRDVPGLLGIENHVQVITAQEHIVRLEQLLVSWALKEHLSYRDRGQRIELQGQLNDAQMRRFALLQTEFNRDFSGTYTLELIAPSSKPTLTFVVRAISLGKVPYIVLSDNRKYPVGATTPEGIKIIAILGDRIVLNKNKQQYIVNIKGNEWHDDLTGRAAG